MEKINNLCFSSVVKFAKNAIRVLKGSCERFTLRLSVPIYSGRKTLQI